MGLRGRLATTADRLVGKYGDRVELVTVSYAPGATEFDPPVKSEVVDGFNAAVRGVRQWEATDSVVSTDLVVTASGLSVIGSVGDTIRIEGVNYSVIKVDKMLAAGQVSAVRYYVRAG